MTQLSPHIPFKSMLFLPCLVTAPLLGCLFWLLTKPPMKKSGFSISTMTNWSQRSISQRWTKCLVLKGALEWTHWPRNWTIGKVEKCTFPKEDGKRKRKTSLYLQFPFIEYLYQIMRYEFTKTLKQNLKENKYICDEITDLSFLHQEKRQWRKKKSHIGASQSTRTSHSSFIKFREAKTWIRGHAVTTNI